MTGLLLNSLSFPRKAGIQSNRARGLPTFFMGVEQYAGSPSPRSGEGGRRPDGVRKAGMGPTQVRGDHRAIRPRSKQRATPHPALRATFPSELGKGCPRSRFRLYDRELSNRMK